MLILLNAFAVGVYDDRDVLVGELILVLFLFEVAAGVDEKDVYGVLAAALEDEDTGGDAGAVEDVGDVPELGFQLFAVVFGHGGKR